MSRKPKPIEYEEDKQIILNAFKVGTPMRRMVDKFNYTMGYVKSMKKTLVDEGLITEEEIKSALAEYLKENPVAQGLDKTKVRKPKGREKAEKRYNRAVENKEKVFELVKQKYNKRQIAGKLGISPTSVNYYIEDLINEHRLQPNEITKGSNQHEIDTERIDRKSPEYLRQREQVVECLRKGWKNYYIRKVLNITTYDFDIYIRDIKRKGIMTTEEIKEIRENKKQEDLKFVADCVKNKLTIEKMRKLRPEFTYNEITPMIKQLIDMGIITQEQVDENRKNGQRQTINQQLELSPEEQIEFVFDKVKKGYTPAEIVESDKTKSLTMHKVLYQKRQLIAKGRITQEEAKKLMEERQREKTQEKHKNIMNKIKEYTELGYSMIEISEEFITEYDYNYLLNIKREYIKENGWYTEEEIKEFKKLRIEREELEKEQILEEERRRLDQKKEEEKKKKKEKLKEYKQLYKIYKRKAKREDKLELDGEENVSVEGRKAFVEVVMVLKELEIDVLDEDMEIIINTFYIHPEIANKQIIKFIILDAKKWGGVEAIEKKITILADVLRNTKYYRPLIEYRRWIKKLNLLPQIQHMKKKGMSNSQISGILGISSVEVSILLNTDEEKFFEGMGIDD